MLEMEFPDLFEELDELKIQKIRDNIYSVNEIEIENKKLEDEQKDFNDFEYAFCINKKIDIDTIMRTTLSIEDRFSYFVQNDNSHISFELDSIYDVVNKLCYMKIE